MKETGGHMRWQGPGPEMGSGSRQAGRQRAISAWHGSRAAQRCRDARRTFDARSCWWTPQGMIGGTAFMLGWLSCLTGALEPAYLTSICLIIAVMNWVCSAGLLTAHHVITKRRKRGHG